MTARAATSETFTVTAPASTGSYNAYFIAYSNDSCTNQPSATLALSNGVLVANGSISGTVYRDSNGSGGFNAGEVGSAASRSV